MIAEAVWLYLYVSGGNYRLGLADVFWVVAYVFFASALFHQFLAIHRSLQRGIIILVVCVLGTLIGAYAFASWLASVYGRPIDLDVLVNTFYGVGDLFLAMAALQLSVLFRSGALGRPWIGLLIFALSDSIYAWLDISGVYTWSVGLGNSLVLIKDLSYFAAYIAIALGCYLQYLLLTYGPRYKI